MRRISPCLALPLSIAALLLQAPAQAGSVPLWGAKASVPIDTSIDERLHDVNTAPRAPRAHLE